jgi:hypothetical protein
MSRIEIRPRGGVEVEKYVEAVMDLEEELSLAGVDVTTFRTRAEPVITTILIAIVGSVLSHYIIKLADRLIQKKRQEPDNVQIIIIVDQQRFELPAEYNQLRAGLALPPHEEDITGGSEKPTSDLAE